MTNHNKTKYKIKKGYENRSGSFRHDLGKIAFGESEQYTKSEKFLKLKEEYLRNDDEFIKDSGNCSGRLK